MSRVGTTLRTTAARSPRRSTFRPTSAPGTAVSPSQWRSASSTSSYSSQVLSAGVFQSQVRWSKVLSATWPRASSLSGTRTCTPPPTATYSASPSPTPSPSYLVWQWRFSFYHHHHHHRHHHHQQQQQQHVYMLKDNNNIQWPVKKYNNEQDTTG